MEGVKVSPSPSASHIILPGSSHTSSWRPRLHFISQVSALSGWSPRIVFSFALRSKGYAVAYPSRSVGGISEHLLASLASAAAAEDRSGPADDREEDRYDEAKGRANDLDMARVLVGTTLNAHYR